MVIAQLLLWHGLLIKVPTFMKQVLKQVDMGDHLARNIQPSYTLADVKSQKADAICASTCY